MEKKKTVSLTHWIHVESQGCRTLPTRCTYHWENKVLFFSFRETCKRHLNCPNAANNNNNFKKTPSLALTYTEPHRHKNSPTRNRENGSKQYQLHYKLWLSALALIGSKYTLYKYPLQALKNVFGWNNPTSQDTETVKNEGPVLGSAGNDCRLSHFWKEGTDGSRFCKSDLKKSKQGDG